jgi:hypothetical protein
VFLASVVISTPGVRAQHRIERAEWLMMGWVLLFLLGVGLFFVPKDVWIRVAAGFVNPILGQSALPTSVDWMLIAAFAAYSGAGGVINATLTQWLRDRGFGMAGTIGFTPTAIGGTRVPLALEGAVFPVTASNLANGASGGTTCARTSGFSGHQAASSPWHCPCSWQSPSFRQGPTCAVSEWAPCWRGRWASVTVSSSGRSRC